MSLAKSISAHVPYLRRFARALTGTQQAGDGYVLATLEALVDQPELVGSGDVRSQLYKTFLRVWGSMPINEHVDTTSGSIEERAAQRNLDSIPPRPRIAFLLSSLEEFKPEEIAEVLDVNVAEANLLLDQSGREIAAQIRTDVLIIEDEALIALDIELLVESLGHRVVNIARTHREAVAAVKENKPGLILADIQLADGSSGLEAVNQILGDIEVPVIFITAFPERFLTGKAPEPAFLVSKPFNVQSLKAVISQALFFDHRATRQ